MPGPYHEIYLQSVKLAEVGTNNLDDQLDATFVWNSPRKIADKLTIELESSSNPIPVVINSFTSISQKSYNMTQRTVSNGETTIAGTSSAQSPIKPKAGSKTKRRLIRCKSRDLRGPG